jgi:tungstate transport system substrate-binding protein
MPCHAHRAAYSALALGVWLLAACSGAPAVPATAPPAERPALSLATTTRVRDSGLLDPLLAEFGRETGFTVQPHVGTASDALRLAAQGDVDALLVDSPAAETALVQSGAGRDRRLIMADDFVLLGAAADPARVAGQPARSALKKIAATGATWVSRRDGSDSNAFELRLWDATMGRDVQHEGWYVSTHQGDAATLAEANRRQAYTLSDRLTYLANRAQLQLRVVLEHDPDLRNPYHFIAVDPARRPGANPAGARALGDFLVSAAGQRLIAGAGTAQYGQALFTPHAGQADPPGAP